MKRPSALSANCWSNYGFFNGGVQAAPPLKDSGNDLIAIKGYVFKAVQVKTTTENPVRLRKLPDRYHLLALVALRGKRICDASLDKTKVFLLSRQDIERLAVNSLSVPCLAAWELNVERIDYLFKSGTRITP